MKMKKEAGKKKLRLDIGMAMGARSPFPREEFIHQGMRMVSFSSPRESYRGKNFPRRVWHGRGWGSRVLLYGFRKVNKRCIFKPNQLPKKVQLAIAPPSVRQESPRNRKAHEKKPSSWPNRVVTMRECLRIPVNPLSLFAALTDAAARPSRLGMNL